MTHTLLIRMPPNGAGAATVGEYLAKLLAELWLHDEGFSGKRPFGNSGWKSEVYFALASAGVVPGRFDADGYLDEYEFDTGAADELIQQAITQMGTPDTQAPQA